MEELDTDFYSEDEDYFGDDFGDYFGSQDENSFGWDKLADPLSIAETINACATPVLRDIYPSVSKLLSLCLVYRLSVGIITVPVWFVNLMSILSGVLCLHSVFSWRWLPVLIFMVATNATILFVKSIAKGASNVCGVTVSLLAIIYFITCECFIVKAEMWHELRGVHMIVAMKAISISFDFDSTKQEKVVSNLEFNPFTFFAYIFHPGSLIFGPWISFSSYIQFAHSPKLASPGSGNGIVAIGHWLFSSALSLSSALIFLTFSTCWVEWIFVRPEIAQLSGSNFKWIRAYEVALSYRSSHYFVSFLSESTAILSGIYRPNSLSDASVSNPFKVELPRSLVQVVTFWNIPMHFWLKTYVFKSAKPMGNFAAVICTYAASSLLHGINFQLTAVLLSLGFYTYAEYVLRIKLAAIYDACILAKTCRADCQHVFKRANIYVRMTNLIFFVISLFHLAYLGVMFDSSSNLQAKGYDMNHTLSSWRDLNFASHWFALATYVFYLVIT